MDLDKSFLVTNDSLSRDDYVSLSQDVFDSTFQNASNVYPRDILDHSSVNTIDQTNMAELKQRRKTYASQTRSLVSKRKSISDKVFQNAVTKKFKANKNAYTPEFVSLATQMSNIGQMSLSSTVQCTKEIFAFLTGQSPESWLSHRTLARWNKEVAQVVIHDNLPNKDCRFFSYEIYQNIVIVIGDNNNPVHQNTFYNTIYQNHEDVYQHVSGNNSDHQNMVHNNPIRQNIGEIYQDVGNNNSVHQNMIHNTIYQTPENTYQNVDDNDSVYQNMIYNYPIYQNPGEIYQNVGNNNSVRQDMIHNTIHQTPEEIYQNVNENNYDHQNMVHNNPISQNTGEIYQDVGDNNFVYQNTIHNTIYQNPGEIYQNVGNNNYVHHDMIHNTIHQTLEDIYQNVDDNNYVYQNTENICQSIGEESYIRQNVIYNHQNNFVAEPNSANIMSVNHQNSVE
ncbi:20675_t:CDS:2 [Entrophospora sp. SA101]|nr:20675_t:CDS:2 [Entrophospora sp. SA101]